MKITNKVIQKDLIQRAIEGKYMLGMRGFYYYLFQYVINNNVQSNAYFLTSLIDEYLSERVHIDVNSQLIDDFEVIKVLDNMDVPSKGFSGMVMIKIPLKDGLCVYGKIWEDNVEEVKESLDYFIKDEYEFGTIDPYINEFEKLEN